MENPRTRIPGEWAPPPPIVVGPSPVEALPPPRIRPEEEFEATLGSLVEHFNTLPPPAFGEAPELAAPTAPRRPGAARAPRSMAVVWVGSLVLGATVAGGVMLGLNLAKRTPRELAVPATAPAPVPEVKIVVKSLPDEPAPVATENSGPAAEPILDAAPAVAEHSAAEETAKVSASPERKVRKVQVRKRARPRPAGPSGPQVPASTGGDGWEDPYK